MTRRDCYLPLIALSACGRRRRPVVVVLPEALAGWTRTSWREMPVSEAPDPLPRNSVVSVQAAEYAGPGKLKVRAYQLERSAVGLDLAQRWRPSADTVFFWARRWFVVIQWEEAER